MSLLTKCGSNSGGGLFNPVSLIFNEGIQVKMSDAISPAEEILTELDISIYLTLCAKYQLHQCGYVCIKTVKAHS